MRQKTSLLFLMVLLAVLFFVSCTGVPNPARDVFDDGQRWTAQEMNMFFDWDDKYYDYENSVLPNIGCILGEDGSQQYFCVETDSESNLNFFMPTQKGAFIATGYFLDAPDEYTYRVKIGHTEDEKILPAGTILTFTREDITEDELFMPDVLGEYERAYPSTLLPSDSSSSNSSTS